MNEPHPYFVPLTDSEAGAAHTLATAVLAEYSTVEDLRLHADAAVVAHELPVGLRRGLAEFRLREPSCLCIVRGFPIDDGALGATPPHWREAHGSTAADVFLLLCGYLLGDPVAWSTKQDGRLVHTIAPVAGLEHAQLAASSLTQLTWHTEDAFHPLRADYLALLCLRNPDRVATTVSCVDGVELSAAHRRVLSEPRFTIRPDGSHLGPRGEPPAGVSADLLERAERRIRAMHDTPEPVPLLFGDPAAPYLRLDQEYAAALPGDIEATAALAALAAAVDRGLFDYVLAPGEIAVIDNYRAVHGRRRFTARYDGTDRWLKRLNITRDLRRSRTHRAAPAARTIF